MWPICRPNTPPHKHHPSPTALFYSSAEEFLQYPVKLTVTGSYCALQGVLNTKVIVFSKLLGRSLSFAELDAAGVVQLLVNG